MGGGSMTQNLREQWLNNAVTSVRGIFHANGYPIPDHIRVSCGFPLSRARSLYRNVGVHFAPELSDDATHQIFISPVLDDSVEVLGVLMHELSHAVTGEKHGYEFKQCVRKVWLEGNPTQTKVGAEFRSNFAPILESLGVYPHAKLNLESNSKPQGTRMLKAVCNNCVERNADGSIALTATGAIKSQYTIRVTKTWADKGLPTCQCGTQFALSK
jgi:hypothetical protein